MHVMIRCLLCVLLITGGMGTLVWASDGIPASVDPAIVAASMEPIPEFQSKRRESEESENNATIDDSYLELEEDKKDLFQDPIVL